ncbi:TrbC/VirB2 family protein [Methylomonas sp. MO1]|uniref:TrbC/VirB2 family protein n=1 Tax=Methylomonas sp. MO1 TaxID=3073619 RepID=UPI0028A46EE8|nr:TrbC/VirB2 family protein [Methylomonas sp. MO1]MDT4292370.1 TrbC/VirB2 family protein [Methylomonas sp. MO1]
MNNTTRKFIQQALIAVLCLFVEHYAFAASPFTTGSGALSTDLLATLTPVAVIAVMALGAFAWFGRISWGVAVMCMLGIVLVFGAQQVVTWTRGLFGV